MKRYIAAIIFGAIIALSFTISNLAILHYPSHFPAPTYDFKNSPLLEAKIQLGRDLFYDPILSIDSTISCASCHSPYSAFAHTDHNLSHGLDDQIGKRNAPPLFNLAWSKKLMWDGAILDIEKQALAPICDPTEMGESISHLISKLNNNQYYYKRFANAFGTSPINTSQLVSSLAQFQLTLISAEAKYDQVKLGLDTFNTQESNGYQIFIKNCSSCHVEPLFTNHSFADNGLSIDTTLNDQGRGTITLDSLDNQKFKVPSLRNLSYTFPYMHDGRYSSIRSVINHYTSLTISSPDRNHDIKSPINLTSDEKVDLISFLLTLNDKTFIMNKKHHFPQRLLNKSNE